MKLIWAHKAGAAVRKAASAWVARRDAGLSAAEEAEFQAWRKADPRHAEAVARYEKLWTQLDRPRIAGAGPQLNRDLALLQRRKRRRRLRAVGVAAMVMLVCVGGWWGTNWRVRAPAPSAGPIVITVPERRILADGTVVEYPLGSELVVDFSSPRLRRVSLLRGEAHFEVVANATRPFVVSAAGVGIRAVGTAFSVQVGSSAVAVLVTEGRVAVDPRPAATPLPGRLAERPPQSPTLVDAGYKLSVTLETNREPSAPMVESCSAPEVERRLAWRSPRMEFSNARLCDVVAAINRYAAERGGVQFTLQDSTLGATRMSGIFRVDDTSAFIGILERGFGIEGERGGEQRIVLRKAL
jgi:transmembrane sensor